MGSSGLQNKGQRGGMLISLDLSLWVTAGYRTKDSKEGRLQAWIYHCGVQWVTVTKEQQRGTLAGLDLSLSGPVGYSNKEQQRGMLTGLDLSLWVTVTGVIP